ncbi:DUF6705 family protein [Winogradskyella sp.]|uniref:DUF6705 family protein n=1 Tax=Winogradskyella sp. TaxID=1883156 RepID=UPI0025DFC7B4|nr:DUF6705 family protein [Winogradskyella sp.]
MKQIIFILTILLLTLSCKAQSPIVSLDAPYETPSGAYYKDLDNELNKFEGNWLYTNGSTSLTIVLQKIEQLEIGSDFRDYLIGDYRYVENNQEIINTLPISNNNENKLGGSYITSTDERPICNDCSENERRISLYISDPERDYLNFTITLRYIIGETNPEKMTITIFKEHGGIIPNENSPVSLRVPAGEYLMEKQ